ncbi:hypothetical protein GCM10018790_57260 [Kitasatospora xanthocidica]|nr:hypothetical protein GCM10018790_57260 [Kitasatospora xanthocidica]
MAVSIAANTSSSGRTPTAGIVSSLVMCATYVRPVPPAPEDGGPARSGAGVFHPSGGGLDGGAGAAR